jgi:DNA-binding GntR family transcriptional regulator
MECHIAINRTYKRVTQRMDDDTDQTPDRTDSKLNGQSLRPVRLPERADDTTAVAEWVADVIRNRIVKGELSGGDRIVERKLSVELAVSRTPVREALKLLRADGLIDISRHRGAQVTTYTSQEALDLFDAIAALESLAAQRLAESLSSGTLGQLEFLHARMKMHFRNAMLEPYFETNSAIHDLIIAECGNPILTESHGKLIVRARRGRFQAIMDENRWAQAVTEHEELMSALRVGDPDAAGKVWGRHLRHTGETVAAMLAPTER